MILAHLADPHLGYRAYHRLGATGRNAREEDVANAFRAAVSRVIELDVDLVLIAGDVFHGVRPPNSAIADAFRQISRLRAALPDAPIVMIAGNHDSPRSTETGCILRLFAEIPDVHVVDDAARTVRLEKLDASVLCVPHAAVVADTEWAPDPDASHNILMLHGTMTGGRAEEKLGRVSEFGGARVPMRSVDPDRWSYVALGHYHIATELAPNMWYAGATERTSGNLWAEDGDKGFLTYDTERGRATFHPVPSRPMVDLPVVSARSPDGTLSAERLDARIADRVGEIDGGVMDKIVRLVLSDVPRELFRSLDHRRIREWKAAALHFHLDVRRPPVARRRAGGPAARRRTLEEEVEHFLKEVWQPAADAVDRARLIELAHEYLAA